MARKYTKELLEPIVKKSFSIAEVVRNLGLRESGGTHRHIKNCVTFFNINISHFQHYTSNLKPARKKNHKEVLVLHEKGSRKGACRLRQALIESGVEYKCVKCDLGEMWNGKLLILEINHKNNNWLDNRKENLEFVCPNCHSQIPHAMNKGKTGIVQRRVDKSLKIKVPEVLNFCVDCNKQISRKTTRCKRCSAFNNNSTKINWPTTELLIEMVQNSSYVVVGKQLGVSDKAVSKRIKNHPV